MRKACRRRIGSDLSPSACCVINPTNYRPSNPLAVLVDQSFTVLCCWQSRSCRCCRLPLLCGIVPCENLTVSRCNSRGVDIIELVYGVGDGDLTASCWQFSRRWRKSCSVSCYSFGDTNIIHVTCKRVGELSHCTKVSAAITPVPATRNCMSSV